MSDQDFKADYIDVGKVIPREYDEARDPNPRNTHPYYSQANGLEFLAVCNNWRKAKGGYKCSVTIDPEKLASTVKTVYQKLYHGRKWLIVNATDPKVIEDVRSIKIHQLKNVIKLSYNTAGAIVDTMASAMSFGEEVVDVQSQFLDWMSTNPPDREVWPEQDIILEDEDVLWFLNAKRKMAEAPVPRFIIEVKGNKVKVTSIVIEEHDHK